MSEAGLSYYRVMLDHPFAVIGLALNTAGAMGLLMFTANPDAGAVLPQEALPSVRLTMPKERRRYRIQVWAYRLSFAALAIGSFLQLLDLLRS
jgi:hypothetical protein